MRLIHGYLTLSLLTAALSFATPQYAVHLVGPANHESQLNSIASNGVTGGAAWQGAGDPVAWINRNGTAEILDLGGLPGMVTQVNAAGQAIGWLTSEPRGFFFDGSQAHLFDSLYIPEFLSDNGIVAGTVIGSGAFWYDGTILDIPEAQIWEMNKFGDVVGTLTDEFLNDNAFTITGGVLTNQHSLLGGTNTEGLAINANGDFAATSYEVCGCDSTGFVVIGAAPPRQIPFPPASSYVSPSYINAGGLTAGEADVDIDGDFFEHVFLFDPSGAGTFTDLNDGELEDFATDALNDAGHVAGSSGTRVFLYRGGTAQYYDSMGSVWSMNSSGDAVGGDDFDETVSFVILDGTMYALNSLNPAGSDFDYLDFAEGITDAGWIGGTGWTIDGQQAFVMQPVPEPGSLAAVGLGAAGLLIWRRRRRA